MSHIKKQRQLQQILTIVIVKAVFDSRTFIEVTTYKYDIDNH